MEIKFSSTVIITDYYDKMELFYQNVLQQKIEVGFGNCIGFKFGLSWWKLTENYPIAKKPG